MLKKIKNEYLNEIMGVKGKLDIINSPVKLGLKRGIIEGKLEMALIASFWV
jgi:hypothetical protein